MIESYAVSAPSCWGGGINLRYKFSRGIYQVDDIDQVFTGGNKSDSTAFFRYPELYEALSRRMAYRGQDRKILSLPSSIGCEAYSLAACFSKHARKTGAKAEVHMSDISDRKLRAAETGTYLRGFSNGLPKEYDGLLRLEDDILVKVDPYIKNMVKALPPSNILDTPQMDTRYDLVMCMNLLCYITDLDDKITAARYLGTLCDDTLVLSYGGACEYEKYKEPVTEALQVEGFKEDVYFRSIPECKSTQVFIRQP